MGADNEAAEGHEITAQTLKYCMSLPVSPLMFYQPYGRTPNSPLIGKGQAISSRQTGVIFQICVLWFWWFWRNCNYTVHVVFCILVLLWLKPDAMSTGLCVALWFVCTSWLSIVWQMHSEYVEMQTYFYVCFRPFSKTYTPATLQERTSLSILWVSFLTDSEAYFHKKLSNIQYYFKHG